MPVLLIIPVPLTVNPVVIVPVVNGTVPWLTVNEPADIVAFAVKVKVPLVLKTLLLVAPLIVTKPVAVRLPVPVTLSPPAKADVVPTCNVPAVMETLPVLELMAPVVANVPLEMVNDAGDVTVRPLNEEVMLLLLYVFAPPVSVIKPVVVTVPVPDMFIPPEIDEVPLIVKVPPLTLNLPVLAAMDAVV